MAEKIDGNKSGLQTELEGRDARARGRNGMKKHFWALNPFTFCHNPFFFPFWSSNPFVF